MPTTDQVKGITERLVAILLVWLVAKGHIGKDEALEYGPIAIGLVSAFYAWWINRPKAIVQSAAAIPGTTVITTPKLASDTPEQNILSTESNTVVGPPPVVGPSPPGSIP
jgi:hypothetical protein